MDETGQAPREGGWEINPRKNGSCFASTYYTLMSHVLAIQNCTMLVECSLLLAKERIPVPHDNCSQCRYNLVCLLIFQRTYLKKKRNFLSTRFLLLTRESKGRLVTNILTRFALENLL